MLACSKNSIESHVRDILVVLQNLEQVRDIFRAKICTTKATQLSNYSVFYFVAADICHLLCVLFPLLFIVVVVVKWYRSPKKNKIKIETK